MKEAGNLQGCSLTGTKKKKKKTQNQKKQSLKKKRKEIEEGEKLPTPVFRISYI